MLQLACAIELANRPITAITAIRPITAITAITAIRPITAVTSIRGACGNLC